MDRIKSSRILPEFQQMTIPVLLKRIMNGGTTAKRERFKALECRHGDPPSANPEQNITSTTMENHKEYGIPSNLELMSLFEQIGYKRGFRNIGGDGGGGIK
ncbi:unnamed protein product [Eruca vesicaria subsp. sativa]|uniref:Uncharacterized protein n=1 Tax=Eruca vesicaria subsp. sativa TaxID=29727 RepID=A0ABC8KYT9_ERUVS|nr:unnamed protein product [Eruca vesicaria subsp. sativa]